MTYIHARAFALLAVGALFAHSAFAAEPSPPPKLLRLEVSLTDGSRLIGETSLPTISVLSDGMGKIEVPLQYIGAISFSSDHKTAAMAFRNGDKLRGDVTGLDSLSLKTLVGSVSIPLGAISDMRVHPAGSGKVIDWTVLPFPKGCDWPGPRGEPATIDGGEIILRGQPVCTAETYGVPVGFECEVTLDQLVSADGCLWIIFVPDGPDAEMSVPPQNVAIQFGYHQAGEGGGMFTVASRGAVPDDFGKGPFTFLPAKTSHLEINLKADGIVARLNGQAFESKLTLPFKSFHIELMGWQPVNTWRIRDFVIQ